MNPGVRATTRTPAASARSARRAASMRSGSLARTVMASAPSTSAVAPEAEARTRLRERSMSTDLDRSGAAPRRDRRLDRFAADAHEILRGRVDDRWLDHVAYEGECDAERRDHFGIARDALEA